MDEHTKQRAEQQPEQVGGAVGVSRAVDTCVIGCYMKASISGGVLAGVIYLAYLLALSSSGDVVHPLRSAASLFLAEDALARAPLGAVVTFGLIDHLLVSLFWGLVFGLVLACGRWNWSAGAIVTLGVLFGAMVWMIDYYIFAPVFWHWMLSTSSLSVFIGHVFFFGLPMGVWVARRAAAQSERQ